MSRFNRGACGLPARSFKTAKSATGTAIKANHDRARKAAKESPRSCPRESREDEAGEVLGSSFGSSVGEDRFQDIYGLDGTDGTDGYCMSTRCPSRSSKISTNALSPPRGARFGISPRMRRAAKDHTGISPNHAYRVVNLLSGNVYAQQGSRPTPHIYNLTAAR
jgi:hypothetical protein